MALLTNTFSVSYGLSISLTFDDLTAKSATVNVNDLIKVKFNKNGVATTVQGIVTKIYDVQPENCHCVGHRDWAMIVDGTSYGYCAMERVLESRILDIDVLKKYSTSNNIVSPIGDSNITSFRVYGNILQLSQDDGKTWQNVTTLQAVVPVIPAEDQGIADMVDAILPTTMRPDLRAELKMNIIKLIKINMGEPSTDDLEALKKKLGIAQALAELQKILDSMNKNDDDDGTGTDTTGGTMTDAEQEGRIISNSAAIASNTAAIENIKNTYLQATQTNEDAGDFGSSAKIGAALAKLVSAARK